MPRGFRDMRRDYFTIKGRNPNFPDPENNKLDRILADVPHIYDPAQLTEEQRIAMRIRDAERSNYNIMKASEALGKSEQEIRANIKRQSNKSIITSTTEQPNKWNLSPKTLKNMAETKRLVDSGKLPRYVGGTADDTPSNPDLEHKADVVRRFAALLKDNKRKSR
jgi:hypothetical protein